MKGKFHQDSLEQTKGGRLFYQLQAQKPSYILVLTQPAFTCSKLTIETLEQGVKYVQS